MFKLFIIILAFASLSLAGDLKLSCDVEPAWIPRAASSEFLPPNQIRYESTDNAFCLTLRPAFDWKYCYGMAELVAFSSSPKEGTSFCPYRMSYSSDIGIKYQISQIHLTTFLGWQRNCAHVVTIATNNDFSHFWKDAGYDKVYLRFHFSN